MATGKEPRELRANYLRQSQVNPVGEGCDDQPPIQPHVLVAIAKGSCALTNVQFIRLSVPVEAQLTFPFELPGLDNAGRQDGAGE